MSDTDIKRLMAIAKNGLRKKRSKEEILNTFVLAGILNLDGTYTDNYPNLKAWEAERKTNK
jgi:hypothetical protein